METPSKKQRKEEENDQQRRINKGKINSQLTNQHQQGTRDSWTGEEKGRENEVKGKYAPNQPHYQPKEEQGGGEADNCPQQHPLNEADDGGDNTSQIAPLVLIVPSPHHQPIAIGIST